MSTTPAPTPAIGSPPPRQQPNQADPEAEQIPHEEETWFTKTFARMSLAWLCSMFLHLIVLIALALFTLTQLTKPEAISLAMADVSNVDEATLEMPMEMEDFEEMEEPLEQLDMVVEEQLDDSLMATDVIADLPLESAEVSMDFGDLGAELTEIGGGEGTGTDGFANASNPNFFKSAGPMAKTVVYMVDNSNSMTGKNPKNAGYGRMETALIELAKSVNSLDKSQKFYVIFYSDTAYGLFYPATENNYVYATPKNKERLHRWLDTVECCLFTRGNGAFEMARQLKPQLIYCSAMVRLEIKRTRKVVANPIKGSHESKHSE